MDAVKEYYFKSTTSKLVERKRLISDVIASLQSFKKCEDENMKIEAVKRVLQALYQTLPLYTRRSSRKLNLELIKMLLTTSNKMTEMFLLHKFDKLASYETQNKTICRAESAKAMVALTWCLEVLNDLLISNVTIEAIKLKSWVKIQAGLLYGVVIGGNKRITKNSILKLKNFLKNNPNLVDKYNEVLLDDYSPASCVLLALIISFKKSIFSNETLTIFTKSIILAKQKTSSSILLACRPILQQINHENFSEIIIPAIQKSLLRSPETCVKVSGQVFKMLKIDLSQHSLMLIKMFVPQLISKNEINSESTVACISQIASQCSDTDSILTAISFLFDVLKGSEGKLTLPKQKSSVLSCIRSFADAPTGSGKNIVGLSSSVVSIFIKHLQQEINESTLVASYSVLSSWVCNFRISVPTDLVDWFIKAPSVKSHNPTVRVTYLSVVAQTFKPDTLQQAEKLVPYLVQSIKRASQQPLQVLPVSEGAWAACIISQLTSIEFKKPLKLDDSWDLILDGKKELFTSDKFLTTATEDTLVGFTSLVYHLFTGNSEKMTHEVSRPFLRGILNIGLTENSLKLNQQVISVIKKLVSSIQGGTWAEWFLKEFSIILCNYHPESTPSISCKQFTNILKTILFMDDNSFDVNLFNKLALQLLNFVYHPYLTQIKQDIWKDYLSLQFNKQTLKQSSVTPHQFITDHQNLIIEMLLNEEQRTKSSLAALKNLIEFAPYKIMPRTRSYILNQLEDIKSSNVTQDDIDIMNTEDGILWNVHIIHSAPKFIENKNMKRESKAYTIEEQRFEKQLKKELAEKRKTPASKKSSSQFQDLNKKQKELLASELEKERIVRKKTQEIFKKFEKVTELLDVVLRARSEDEMFDSLFTSFIEVFLHLLHSPLTSSNIQKLFIQLSRIFNTNRSNDILIMQISFATLRLSKPIEPVDAAWCHKSLHDVIPTLITGLDDVTSAKGALETEYGSSFFCFIFPMFRMILEDGGAVIDGDVGLLRIIIKIIQRFTFESTSSLFDPDLLPTASLLATLCKLVSITSGVVKEESSKVLLVIARTVDICASEDINDEVHQLLVAMESPVNLLRLTALDALKILADRTSEKIEASADFKYFISRRIWVAMHDEQSDVVTLATDLWNGFQLSVEADFCSRLLIDVEHFEPIIQESASRALRSSLEHHPEIITNVVEHLIQLYQVKLEKPAVQMDMFGRVIGDDQPDEYPIRLSVACCIESISPVLDGDHVASLFHFFLERPFCDINEEVRNRMLQAAIRCINDHGQKYSDQLLEILENFLENAPKSESYDVVRQNCVILLGTLASHLNPTDPKIKPIVSKLIETLSTPSQAVQQAVADCLPALTATIREDAEAIVKKLLFVLLESVSYGERKGAAYGLAGIIKGLGLIAFKQMDIITSLITYLQDKQNFRHREGALMAFEMFCTTLGRLFEPYVKQVLPHLLFCFGDGNQFVREAANNTAKAIMRNLSAHGVRLVLPSLLEAIDTQDSWRTKSGSAELLGAMSFCAPRQLTNCLPSIVPKLCAVLTDSHIKVQSAGRQALSQIASVIRNPEVLQISKNLHKALCDPSAHNDSCLQKLLDTQFIHKIDAPSLALILPVVTRGFNSRSTQSRKMAAQIMANMYSLTEQKDLEPYLPKILPGLKSTLLDPVPEVRGNAAKALGAMVNGSGEKCFENLFPWLMEKLTCEQSCVDRSGAAQGLSETLAALGVEKLRTLMTQVVATAQSTEIPPHVRDGYIMLFIYLPVTFGEKFTPFIGDVIMPILKALADETEFLRATALMAGKRIITTFAETSITFLLPELEAGIFDDNWRIRLSSVQLLGDLLFHLSGVTGKMSATGADDENYGTSEGFKAIATTLGKERRDLVLSGLYICRADVALRVRQTAVHVWKIVVPNTPRLLREILPTLLRSLVNNLASSNSEKRQVAAKTLGDIVRKLGERTLPNLIPILENNLDSSDASQRQGVCIGLSEIITACSKDAISVFTDNLVPAVRKALCDDLLDVRTAASRTFEQLHNTIGVQALEGVLPHLLKDLESSSYEASVVDGLKQIIAVKGKFVLPYILPKLLEDPVNTQVLALLSSVAGDAITKHLSTILKVLQTSLCSSIDDDEHFEKVLSDATLVVLSVSGDHGNRIIINDLVESLKSSTTGMRLSGISLLKAIVKDGKIDVSDYYSIFIHDFIRLLADRNENIRKTSWDSLSALISSIPTAEIQSYISSVRSALRSVKLQDTVVETGTILGFCVLKQGLAPLLPIIREGLLNGPAEMKEQAARCLSETVVFLTPLALKHSVVGITGPLIRVLGDRFGSSVRIAVLDALALLLEKVGSYLKPFLTQLQTTFCKALQDNHRAVRLHAATALRHLCTVHAKSLDALIQDLISSIQSSEDISFRETYFQTLRGCIKNGGKKISETIRRNMVDVFGELIDSEEESDSRCASGCLGSLINFMDENEIEDVFKNHFNEDENISWEEKQGRSWLVAVTLKESFKAINEDNIKILIRDCASFMSLDRVQIVNNAVHALIYVLFHSLLEDNDELASTASNLLIKGLRHPLNDVKSEVCRCLVWVNHQLKTQDTTEVDCLSDSLVHHFLPIIITLARERKASIRSEAELAIISLLKMRTDHKTFEDYIEMHPGKTSDQLKETFVMRLKRLSFLEVNYEQIDDTIVSI